jgi:hypothetical protein
LSSAILYLAIVAIWACVLVPRWLRRSHVAPSDPEVLSDQNEADQAEYEPSEEFAPGGPSAATDFAAPGGEGTAAYADPVAWEDPAAPAAPESSVEASYSVTASYSSYSAEVTYSAENVGSGAPAGTAGSGAPAGTAGTGAPAGTAGTGAPAGTGATGAPAGHTAPGALAAHGVSVGHGAPAAHGDPAAGPRHPQGPMRPPGPAPHVLQARRRTLTMLIAITVAVIGAALIGLVPWWTSVPPFVILGMYLLLLREAAHADAERARSWSEAHARADHAAQLARERAREAQVAPPPQPTAEIINISALAAEARDQPYDQYADAEIRAVGD